MGKGLGRSFERDGGRFEEWVTNTRPLDRPLGECLQLVWSASLCADDLRSPFRHHRDCHFVTLDKKKRLGLFIDYPWNEGSSKFSAPFVGSWDESEKHTTKLSSLSEPRNGFKIAQKANDDVFYTHFGGDISIRRHVPEAHRYFIFPTKTADTLALTVHFGQDETFGMLETPSKIIAKSAESWDTYWTETGFIDLSRGPEVESTEIQRRIVLSRYLLRVNEAGDLPPQEVGPIVPT